MTNDLLGIGITGKSLTDLERRILRDSTPYAVVLFGRNIAEPRQLRELVAEVKSLARVPPLFMIDEEGGRVDRLRQLIPGLPSAEAFGEGERAAEMSGWSGRVIGMTLRWFDVEVDLAPVVDIRGAEAPKGLERRTFGGDADTVRNQTHLTAGHIAFLDMDRLYFELERFKAERGWYNLNVMSKGIHRRIGRTLARGRGHVD